MKVRFLSEPADFIVPLGVHIGCGPHSTSRSRFVVFSTRWSNRDWTLTILSTLSLRMLRAIPHFPYSPSCRGNHLSTGNSSVRLETNLKLMKREAGAWNYPPTSMNVEVRNVWRHTSIPPVFSWQGALLSTDMTWQSSVHSRHTESCGAELTLIAPCIVILFDVHRAVHRNIIWRP